jgi:hypothetical protein
MALSKAAWTSLESSHELLVTVSKMADSMISFVIILFTSTDSYGPLGLIWQGAIATP